MNMNKQLEIAVSKMDRAIACLAVELPEAVYVDIAVLWNQLRASFYASLTGDQAGRCRWVNGKKRFPEVDEVIVQYRPEGIQSCSWELKRASKGEVIFLCQPSNVFDVVWLDESLSPSEPLRELQKRIEEQGAEIERLKGLAARMYNEFVRAAENTSPAVSENNWRQFKYDNNL